jgi:hypothetical protein
MADSAALCCFGTGFTRGSICTGHLREAYASAMSEGDKELAAVIILKATGKL